MKLHTRPVPMSEVKRAEAQALAQRCSGRPDFMPCDGLSVCATHSHGKCFRLHWCCHLGWCHCKYVYQPMTSVCELPSTRVPAAPSSFYSDSVDLSISLTQRFLRIAPCLRPPLHPDSPRYCNVAQLFLQHYAVKRINGKMCYVQRPPPRSQTPPAPPTHMSPSTQTCALDEVLGHAVEHCRSPSSSEDSGIPTAMADEEGREGTESEEEEEEGREGTESEEEEVEEEQEVDEFSMGGVSRRGSVWGQEECVLLTASTSTLEIIENIETTV